MSCSISLSVRAKALNKNKFLLNGLICVNAILFLYIMLTITAHAIICVRAEAIIIIKTTVGRESHNADRKYAGKQAMKNDRNKFFSSLWLRMCCSIILISKPKQAKKNHPLY